MKAKALTIINDLFTLLKKWLTGQQKNCFVEGCAYAGAALKIFKKNACNTVETKEK